MRTFQDITNDIIKGMELSKQAMIEEGLWNERTTFDEWSNYAGSHCLINDFVKEAELFPPGIKEYSQ